MSRLFLSRNLVWKRRARRLHRAGLRRLPLHRVQPALAIRRPVAGDDPPPPCCPACLPACLSAPHHPSSVCSHARCVSCPRCPADSSTRRHHRADTSPSWAVACCRVHGVYRGCARRGHLSHHRRRRHRPPRHLGYPRRIVVVVVVVVVDVDRSQRERTDATSSAHRDVRRPRMPPRPSTEQGGYSPMRADHHQRRRSSPRRSKSGSPTMMGHGGPQHEVVMRGEPA
jgi:hypothetical protein